MGISPPYELEEELIEGAACVKDSLQRKNALWLFPDGFQGPPREDRPRPSAPFTQDERDAFRGFEEQYSWRWIHQEHLRKIVGRLWSRPQQRQSITAKQVKDNFVSYVWGAYEEANYTEEVRHNLSMEAEAVVTHMVRNKWLQVSNDLVFCLDVFKETIGEKFDRATVRTITGHSLGLLEAALNAAHPADADKFRQERLRQIKTSDASVYGIDVRVWPEVLARLLMPGQPPDFGILEDEAIKSQIINQLTFSGHASKWIKGQQEAAEVIDELGKVGAFEPDEILKMFNHEHTPNRERKANLARVLRKADRSLKQQVLREIDDDDVDVTNRRDEDMRLIQELIVELHEDVRVCPKTYFRMKVDWIISSIENEELTPDQIFDHIEYEENFADLLKEAVKCYAPFELKGKRSAIFEAAKLLSKRAAKGTQVYEARRNDKQIMYLLGLFKEEIPAADRFGPLEGDYCVTVPERDPMVKVLRIGSREQASQADDENALQTLRTKTLEAEYSLVIGVSWCWQCFDTHLDFWTKARCVAFSFMDAHAVHYFAIVDFKYLEEGPRDKAFAAQARDVVGRIMEADHLLKVVCGVDHRSLAILQRAVHDPEIPATSDFGGPQDNFARMMPVVDVAIAAAYVLGTRPSDPLLRLRPLTYLFLNLELCQTEVTSSYERRLMRNSQEHFALTQAWVPRLILLALAARPADGPIISADAVAAMILRLDTQTAPRHWDKHLQDLPFATDGKLLEQDPGSAFGDRSPEIQDKDPWQDDDFKSQLPRPREPHFDIRNTLINAHLEALCYDSEVMRINAANFQPWLSESYAKHSLDLLYKPRS
mmetsp:Transcript_43663/g.103030  ORF Transcript_43663/g.103030 Transcript_43663/m.103030 type:complete len:825 (+) Transcript_43663:113-2587(+)